jgi:hypothetical protein
MFCQRLSFSCFLILVGLVNAIPTPYSNLHLQRRAQAQATDITPQQWNQALKTGPGQAVFWSGRTGKVSSRVAAAEYAKKTGGKTLAMAMGDAGIPLPIPPRPGPSREAKDERQWATPSKKFAQKAQGEIHVFLGDRIRPYSVYMNHEKGPLMNNPKVTKITEHYHDGTTKVIKGPGSKASDGRKANNVSNASNAGKAGNGSRKQKKA